MSDDISIDDEMSQITKNQDDQQLLSLQYQNSRVPFIERENPSV